MNFPIGELSRRTGVKVPTIRFYEQIGLLADQASAISFFCGHSANSWQFTGLFDGVFILVVDADTLSTRLMKRPEDEFGGKPIERELVMRLHETKEDLPRDAVSIEANAPITRVVDEILSKCSSAQAAH